MAQVENASAGKSSGEGKAGAPSVSSDSPPRPTRNGLVGLGRQWLTNRAGQNGQAANGTKPKRGQTFQFFFGLILFMLGSQVLLYLLSFVGNAFHAQAALQSTIAPRSQGVFLLSGLSWFEFFWFALVALLYYVLIKTKLLPTDPWGNKERARAQAAQRGTTRTGASGSGGSKASTVTTVNVRPVTRADRRAADQERAARAAAAAAAKQSKQSKRAKSGQTAAPPPAPESAARSGSYDSEYERAKAAQRQMRRREAKR